MLPLRRSAPAARSLSRPGSTAANQPTPDAVPLRSDDAGPTAGGQLVARVLAGFLSRSLPRHLDQRGLDLAPHPADGDAEDALTALHEIDDLVGRRAFVHARAVAHQRDAREILGAAFAQVLDRLADLLERNSGVEKPLDDLEDQDVAEGVETLGSRSGRRPNGRLDQAGPRPVVELAVGDAGHSAGGGSPKADVVRYRPDHALEQQALAAGLGGSVARRRADRPRAARGVSAHVEPSVRSNRHPRR